MNQERSSLFDFLSLIFFLRHTIYQYYSKLFFISLLNYIFVLKINKCLLWKSGQLRNGKRGLKGKYKSLITFLPEITPAMSCLW